jgi:hypothetical protein
MDPISEIYRYIVRSPGLRGGKPVVVLLTCNRDDFVELALQRPTMELSS